MGIYVLFILVAVIIGIGVADEEGGLLGVVLGYLVAEVFSLRKRLRQVEKEIAVRGIDDSDSEVIFTPEEGEAADAVSGDIVTGEPVTDGAPAADIDTPVWETMPESAESVTTEFRSDPQVEASPYNSTDREEAEPSSLERFLYRVRQFLTTGNLVLKMGLVVLFFGVAFFVKYAAQENLVPIELRLVGAALGGMVLLGLGWRLRSRSGGYGLGLQGGGVGILYLVVYGAAKLYDLLPMELSLGLMVALVVFSGVLAVIQDARSLAFFGVIGGFLAPVLMSTGGGSHVVLFSYYGLLNLGIFGIAWYKAWRELNLLGFFFTFGIATLWGAQGYRPEHFATTEPFLILYFLFYLFISVLFAHRQPVNLKGYIDGPLVFGLPLVATGLQYALVREFPYGMAISACSLGIFYLLLATVLWRRLAGGMRLLCEAFLALGVMFATMTIPLALDSDWSSAVWALEGGAMVWVGVRQHRLLARLSGIALQLGAAWMFVSDIFYPFGATAFLNRYFFGCLFLALAAMFSSYWLSRRDAEVTKAERYLALPLLVWGLCWWYFGGVRECDRNLAHLRFGDALLLYSAASTIAMTIVAVRVSWRQLAIGQTVQLVSMIIAFVFGMLDMSSTSHLLAGWGKLAWGIALYCQYRMLHEFDDRWPRLLMGSWHVGTLWLLVLLVLEELGWLVDDVLHLSSTWMQSLLGVVPAAAVLLLIVLGDRPVWPLGRWRDFYRGAGVGVPVLLLGVWLLVSLQWGGEPAPLVYLPVFNPLELASLFLLLVLLFWVRGCEHGTCRMPVAIDRGWLRGGVAVLIFLFVNGVVARMVHFWGNIPYQSELLYHSVVFQAALAALWSLGALSLTVWAARAGNRLVWCCGATLLALVVVKLFVVDLSGTGTVARIVSFIVVGVLMLVIGYFSPMPPGVKEERQ